MTSLTTQDCRSLARSLKRMMKLRNGRSTESVPKLYEPTTLKKAVSEKSLKDRIRLGKDSVKQVTVNLKTKNHLGQDHCDHGGSSAATTESDVRQKEFILSLEFLKDAVFKKNLSLLAGSTAVVLEMVLKITSELATRSPDEAWKFQSLYIPLGELTRLVDGMLISGELSEQNSCAVNAYAKELTSAVQKLYEPDVRSYSSSFDSSHAPIAPKRRAKSTSSFAELTRKPICDSSLLTKDKYDKDYEFRCTSQLPESGTNCFHSKTNPTTLYSNIDDFIDCSTPTFSSDFFDTAYSLNFANIQDQAHDRILDDRSYVSSPPAWHPNCNFMEQFDCSTDQSEGMPIYMEKQLGSTVVTVKRVCRKEVVKSTIVKTSERVLPLSLDSTAFDLPEDLSSLLTLENLKGGIRTVETTTSRMTGHDISSWQLNLPSNDLANISSPFDDQLTKEPLSTDSRRHSVQTKVVNRNHDRKSMSHKTFVNENLITDMNTGEESTKVELRNRKLLYKDDNVLKIQEEHFCTESNSVQMNGLSSVDVNFRDTFGPDKVNLQARNTSVVSSYTQIFGSSQPTSVSEFRSSALVSYETLRDRWRVNLTEARQSTVIATNRINFNKCTPEVMDICSYPLKKMLEQKSITFPQKLALLDSTVRNDRAADHTISRSECAEECTIKDGSVDALIAHAISPNGGEEDGFLFQEAFINTYRSFISSVDLLHKLIRSFQAEFNQAGEEKKRTRSIFSFIVRVVDGLTMLEATSQTMATVTDFIYLLTKSGQLSWARLLRQRFVSKYNDLLAMQRLGFDRPLFSRNNHNYHKSVSIADFKSSSLAQQITYLDWFYFQKIDLSEVLLWSISQDEKQCPNLTQFTSHFNKMSYWVRTQVICSPELRERERCFTKFLKIMRHLRRMGNLNSCLALLAALDSGPIRRLDWPRVALEQLSTYSALIDSSQSFKIYRCALAETKPPCLPYLGLILQDLTFVHVGNPDIVPSEEDPNKGVINFGKRWQQFTILDNVRRFKLWPYNIIPDDGILSYFNNFDEYLDEEQIWEISERLKPRASICKPP